MRKIKAIYSIHKSFFFFFIDPLLCYSYCTYREMLLWRVIHTRISLCVPCSRGLWQQLKPRGNFPQFPDPTFPTLTWSGSRRSVSWGTGCVCEIATLLPYISPPQSLTKEQYPIIWRTTLPHCQLYIRSQFLGMSPNIWLALKGLRHSCSAQFPIDEKQEEHEIQWHTDISILLSTISIHTCFICVKYGALRTFGVNMVLV